MVKSKCKLKIVESIEIAGNSEDEIAERARELAIKKGYLAFKLEQKDDSSSSELVAKVRFLGMEA